MKSSMLPVGSQQSFPPYIKSQGIPAGVAGHELATIKGAEEHNVGADFYMKTLHSRDYWSWKPEQEKDKMIIDNYSVDNYWDSG